MRKLLLAIAFLLASTAVSRAAPDPAPLPPDIQEYVHVWLAPQTHTGGGGTGGGGTGTVTSIGTAGPITGGTITTTGSIGCATCVTSAAALTSNAVMIGGGLQASSTISAATTTTFALFATAGAPAFRALAAGDIPVAIPIANIGSAGLSGTAPITISAAGAIGCSTCNTSSATVTSIATTAPLGGGTITTSGTLTCTTCVVASSPGVGIAHFAGSTQTVTSSAIVAADITNNTITGTQLASSLALVTPSIGAATGTSLLATGIVDGEAPVIVTTGTTGTPGATYNHSYSFNEEATAGTGVTYTLPTAAAGKQYCFANAYNGSAANTGVLTVAASASGQFIIFTDGTLSATGGNVTSAGAAADAACFVGVDATHWFMYVQSGAWSKH